MVLSFCSSGLRLSQVSGCVGSSQLLAPHMVVRSFQQLGSSWAQVMWHAMAQHDSCCYSIWEKWWGFCVGLNNFMSESTRKKFTKIFLYSCTVISQTSVWCHSMENGLKWNWGAMQHFRSCAVSSVVLSLRKRLYSPFHQLKIHPSNFHTFFPFTEICSNSCVCFSTSMMCMMYVIYVPLWTQRHEGECDMVEVVGGGEGWRSLREMKEGRKRSEIFVFSKDAGHVFTLSAHFHHK